MDYIIYELLGFCDNPLELAVRFLVLILVLDGIFGIVGTLFRPLLDRR